MPRRVYRCPKDGALKAVVEEWPLGKHTCDECGSVMKVLFQPPNLITETGSKS